ncbi:MAG: SAM-dependent methyltransferase, partial [Tepidiformaceae bacterium]
VVLSRSFDAIVMAVMIFLQTGTENAVVANMARHLQAGGVLIAGFQVIPGRLAVQGYDEIAVGAGLALAERWSTWNRDAWDTASDYAVSVHGKKAIGPK